MSPRRVAVIGAGLSGLSCARVLRDGGIEVTVLEKSRSLGGRCSTRRWEGHIVDHGAQFFTIRDDAFATSLRRLPSHSLRVLTAPVFDSQGGVVPCEGGRCYHLSGNSRLALDLADGLKVTFETTVERIELVPGGVVLLGQHYDAVVTSAPWPQSAKLLGLSAPPAFAPCLTAFFSYRGSFAGNSRHTYARDLRGSPLAWSACENHKVGRILAGQTVFVAQASPKFSQDHLEAEPELWSAKLRQDLEQQWELPASERLSVFTHRWRYARRLGEVGVGELPPGVFLTGDSLATSRVESVWLDGVATAEKVLKFLT